MSATEFNATAPLLLQIHHMFWSVPLLLVLPLLAGFVSAGLRRPGRTMVVSAPLRVRPPSPGLVRVRNPSCHDCCWVR